MNHVDEYDNKYADGTPYSAGTEYKGTLIYSKVTVSQDAILFKDFGMSQHAAVWKLRSAFMVQDFWIPFLMKTYAHNMHWNKHVVIAGE